MLRDWCEKVIQIHKMKQRTLHRTKCVQEVRIEERRRRFSDWPCVFWWQIMNSLLRDENGSSRQSLLFSYSCGYFSHCRYFLYFCWKSIYNILPVMSCLYICILKSLLLIIFKYIIDQYFNAIFNKIMKIISIDVVQFSFESLVNHNAWTHSSCWQWGHLQGI